MASCQAPSDPHARCASTPRHSVEFGAHATQPPLAARQWGVFPSHGVSVSWRPSSEQTRALRSSLHSTVPAAQTSHSRAVESHQPAPHSSSNSNADWPALHPSSRSPSQRRSPASQEGSEATAKGSGSIVPEHDAVVTSPASKSIAKLRGRSSRCDSEQDIVRMAPSAARSTAGVVAVSRPTLTQTGRRWRTRPAGSIRSPAVAPCRRSSTDRRAGRCRRRPRRRCRLDP